MKFFVALVAFWAVFALTAAAPRPNPVWAPYSVYGGSSASAAAVADASSYNNAILSPYSVYGPTVGLAPSGYGYAPSYGGYWPGTVWV